MSTSSGPASPIGVFDSGIGGISVLRALHAELPLERFVYVADAGHAPYGERDDAYLLARAHAVTRYLIERHTVKALVVACNTATAAAIRELRQTYPDLPIVGIEPALKPAAAVSKTGLIGVMATRGTLNSDKFGNLLQSLRGAATFVLQPCDGLADAIEHNDAIKIEALCIQYTQAMGAFGLKLGEMDTLVLGCTHYPFIADQLSAKVGTDVVYLEGGVPVARQTRRLLTERQALAPEQTRPGAQTERLAFFSTGDATALAMASLRWMGRNVAANAIDIPNLQAARRLAC
ncbi:MAG: glutamate racemase [Burkholderiales bacterium PBB3]|nr:MAG: glutamate racemase [Burkholderiales bacterium PBB3]